MNKFHLLLCLILGAFIFSGCSDAKSRPLATVDGKVITIGDFEKRLAELPPYYKTFATQRQKDFLDDMIAKQLLYKEALRRGLDRDADVRELLKEARQKILIAKLIEVEEKKKHYVGEEQIREFYELRKNDFVNPLKLRASHIQVETESQANDILQKLKSGGDFGELARQYSKDPSMQNGGDIGYFTKGQLLPEIESAVFELKIGEISDLIRTQIGYHIIKLTDRIEPHVAELSEVRKKIEKELNNKAQKDTFESLIKNLRSKTRIKVNDKLLEGGFK